MYNLLSSEQIDIINTLTDEVNDLGIAAFQRELSFYSLIDFDDVMSFQQWDSDKLVILQKKIANYLFNQSFFMNNEVSQIDLNNKDKNYLIYSYVNLVLTSKIFLVNFQGKMENIFLKDNAYLTKALNDILNRIKKNLPKLKIADQNNPNLEYELNNISIKNEQEDSYTITFEFESNVEDGSNIMQKERRKTFAKAIDVFFKKEKSILFKPFIRRITDLEVIESFEKIEELSQNKDNQVNFNELQKKRASLTTKKLTVPVTISTKKKNSLVTTQQLIDEQRNSAKNNEAAKDNNSISSGNELQKILLKIAGEKEENLEQLILKYIKKNIDEAKKNDVYINAIIWAFEETLKIFFTDNKDKLSNILNTTEKYKKIKEEFENQQRFFYQYYERNLKGDEEIVKNFFKNIIFNSKEKINNDFEKIIETYGEEKAYEIMTRFNENTKRAKDKGDSLIYYYNLVDQAIKEFYNHWIEGNSGQLIIGDLGEYVTTSFLNNIKNSQTSILAKSTNDQNKQLHVDILLCLNALNEVNNNSEISKNLLGVQSKYAYSITSNLVASNLNTFIKSFSFKIYENTAPALLEKKDNDVTYGADASRYFKNDKEFHDYAHSLQEEDFYNGEQWLNIPISNFSKWVRYEDRTAGEFATLKNDFYAVNGFYMPASYIFKELYTELLYQKSDFFTTVKDENKEQDSNTTIMKSTYFDILKAKDGLNRLQFNGYRLKFSNIITI